MRDRTIGVISFCILLFPLFFLLSEALELPHAWLVFPTGVTIIVAHVIAWVALSAFIDWSIYKLFKK
jgi:hypothetical protein